MRILSLFVENRNFTEYKIETNNLAADIHYRTIGNSKNIILLL